VNAFSEFSKLGDLTNQTILRILRTYPAEFMACYFSHVAIATLASTEYR